MSQAKRKKRKNNFKNKLSLSRSIFIFSLIGLSAAFLVFAFFESNSFPDFSPAAIKSILSCYKAPREGAIYERKTIKTKRGNFDIDLVTIDLGKKNIKILSDTAAGGDCKNNCPARPLRDYVLVRKAFAGMHGAYFCPPDYSWCQSKINYYFYPFYNTAGKFLVNSGEIKWLQGSILVFDENAKAYFFVDGREFKGLSQFETKYNTKIQALISNSPALIAQGKNIVSSQKMDNKQLATKGNRGGIGVKGKVVYLVIARVATVPDLAAIMEALQVDSGLNLDGGGSSALYWNGEYKVGPGRLLPTAILFRTE